MKKGPLLVQNEEHVCEMRSFNWGLLPPFVYTDVIHAVKCSQAFPLHVCILQAIKNWTVGRPGNEAMFCSIGLRQGVGQAHVHNNILHKGWSMEACK